MALSNIAFSSKYTKGRIYREAVDPTRDDFQRDRGRIISSRSFRKLAYKTQVFIENKDDYYRTRLTHSLEVAQIAKSICYQLGLNQDLAETISLAHDLGHPPFAHDGEEGLKEAIAFSAVKFEHNLQSLRIVVELEKSYPNFSGLNLTWEAIEGLGKHNGPVAKPQMNYTIKAYDLLYNLELAKYPTLEGQIASLADEIAYNNHDIDDGLRSGIIKFEDMIEVPLLGSFFAKAKNDYPKLETKLLIKEGLRKGLQASIIDLTTQTIQNIKNFNIKTHNDVSNCGHPLVGFSEEMQECIEAIRSMVSRTIHSYYEVHRLRARGKAMVKNLFNSFYQDLRLLPAEWYMLASESSEEAKITAICDYIAGMTDRFALLEHRRIFGYGYGWL